MNIFKLWRFLPIVFLAMAATACGGDEPKEPEKEIPTEDITMADFVGVWKLDADEYLYFILNADRTGTIIEFSDDLLQREEGDFVWNFNNMTLTMSYGAGSETYIVSGITNRTMTLVDTDGYKETYVRIDKSDIPGESAGDTPGGDTPGGENPGGVSSSTELTTLSAEPQAFRAVLKGKYSGGKLPESVGFDICYYKDFPEEYIMRQEIEGKFGGYSIEVKNLVDLATVYFRAVAVVDGKTIYGEPKRFETLQGTYKINGKEYKFIKVTGLSTGSFSMMQTELPPQATLEIDGVERVLDINEKDGGVTKGETREFMSRDWPVMLRYPSAQEWMYAASGASKSAGFEYAGSDDINEVAWYADNSNGHARSIAQKKANELGFYDMSGNYAEICAAYDDDIMNKWIECSRKSVIGAQNISALMFNTMWAAKGGAFGGSWNSAASNCTTGSSVSNVQFPNNPNLYDRNIYAVRWTYSRPD